MEQSQNNCSLLLSFNFKILWFNAETKRCQKSEANECQKSFCIDSLSFYLRFDMNERYDNVPISVIRLFQYKRIIYFFHEWDSHMIIKWKVEVQFLTGISETLERDLAGYIDI